MIQRLPLSVALTCALLAIPVAQVCAQAEVSRDLHSSKVPEKTKDADAPTGPTEPALFPNATRAEPKMGASKNANKARNALVALQGKPESRDELVRLANAILADEHANAFDKSSAAYMAGGALANKPGADHAEAIGYLRTAIDGNALPNNIHFQAMLQIAQLLNADRKQAEALTYLDRFSAETKSDDPRASRIRSSVLAGMNQPGQAAAAAEASASKGPMDKAAQINMAILYQQSGNNAKASEVFQNLHRAGLLTSAQDYSTAWHLLATLDGHEIEAQQMIDEGVRKKILVPGFDEFLFQANNYNSAGDTDKAIEAWNKAAPLSKDGVTYLNIAKLQLVAGRYAQAREAAQNALGKGIKKQGEAWQVIGQSEAALGNKAGALTAYRQASAFPETKEWADRALRQASGK